MFRVSPVTYRDHRRWPRGSIEGGKRPQEARWAKCGREPAPRWAGAPPHSAHSARERKGGANPRPGGPKAHQMVRHPLLPLLAAAPPIWRAAAPPRRGKPSRGRSPSLPLYIVGTLGCWRDQSSSPSAQPCSSFSSTTGSGPGGPPEGGHDPGRLDGPSAGGEPAPGWAGAPPTLSPRRRRWTGGKS